MVKLLLLFKRLYISAKWLYISASAKKVVVYMRQWLYICASGCIFHQSTLLIYLTPKNGEIYNHF